MLVKRGFVWMYVSRCSSSSVYVWWAANERKRNSPTAHAPTEYYYHLPTSSHQVDHWYKYFNNGFDARLWTRDIIIYMCNRYCSRHQRMKCEIRREFNWLLELIRLRYRLFIMLYNNNSIFYTKLTYCSYI